MRICMVLEHDFPPDIRVEKETRSLLEAGHEVTIVCDNKERRAEADTWGGARVVRVRSGAVSARLSTLARLTLFRDPRFARALRRERGTADAFHVHDLPLASTVLAVARRARLPVVVDLHENFPAFLRSCRADRPFWRRLVGASLSPVWRWTRYERSAASKASGLLVVVEETAARLSATGIPAERITVVENTEDPGRFLALPVEPVAELADAGRGLVMLYVGGLGGRHRGLETVLDGMPVILRTVPEALLVVVGDGSFRARLERRARALGIEDSVLLLGWQPFERVPSFIAASDLCLVPHASDPHTEAALPHKLFQYMLMAKPVIVSSCRPLRRVVEETGAGVVFEADDADSFAEAVLSLRDPERRRALGAAGLAAASTSHGWSRSAERLVEAYATLS